MMKYFFLALSLFVFSFNVQAQTKAEKEKAEYERKVEEKKAEYIANIVNSFELDEFQKQMLTIRLHSYYQEVTKISLLDVPSFEKKTLVEDFGLSHFKDFEEMLGKDFVAKLLEKAKGEDQSDQKKKKKRKKRKKDNK